MKPPFFRLTLPLVLALASTAPRAAEPAPEQLDKVTVEHRGTSSVAPYAGINSLLAGLQRYGEGLFRFEFRLKPSDPKKPLPSAPTLALQHADFYRPLAVQADGLVELPVLAPELAKDADLVSNQAKGSLQLAGTLLLTTPPNELDMAGVRHVMAVSNRLRSELLPWYARWLFPQLVGVRVCSAQPAWELEWRDKGGQLLGLPLPVDKGDRDPDAAPGKPATMCTTLTGHESWPDAARLRAPADAKLSVRLLN